MEETSYHVSIEQFEGPLDLLLHLIRKAEIDIRDIFVSEITSQYLQYMQELDTVDMDKASDFLTMAATLLYIKSRQLLPDTGKQNEQEEEEPDPEEQLIRQLREYKAFKEAGDNLKQLYEAAKDTLSRLPEDVPLPPKRLEMEGATMEGLYEAFLRILEKTDRQEETKRLQRVRADSFTVRRQTRKIRSILVNAGKDVAFEDLFGEHPEKMEVIVTFMALLEMTGRGEIHIHQSRPFAPIVLRAKKLLSEDSDIAYMDEIQEEET
ncbi:MAG: segregation/condensation protein A [Clostridia bacterium]|nr:segregation/condensation protein A [Clostridia bacterium]MCR5073643.1 segregation/condensation protein A [Clostridiales bacterium]